MYYQTFLKYVLESWEVKLQNLEKKFEKNTPLAHILWSKNQKLLKI